MERFDFRINLHDIYPVGLLRLVMPNELFTALSRFLPHRKIIVEEIGFEEGRINYGFFKIDGHPFYYQVCGLFAGDEFFAFPKTFPKPLVDEILAAWELQAAFELKKHLNNYLSEENALEIEGKKIKILTPAEALAEQSIEEKTKYVKQLTKLINEGLTEAHQVLNGAKSFWESKLRKYQPRKTLGESLLEVALLGQKISQLVEKHLQQEPPEIRFLVKSYLEWKVKLTGFENLFNSFDEKIRTVYQGLSTAPQRGWPLTSKEKQECVYYKKALEDKKIAEKVIALGEQLLPLLQQKGEEQSY